MPIVFIAGHCVARGIGLQRLLESSRTKAPNAKSLGSAFETRRRSSHDVIARIDVQDFTGDAAGEIAHQIRGRFGDFLTSDVPTQGSHPFVELEHLVEVAHRGRAERLDRAGAQTIHAKAVWTKLVSQVFNAAIQGRFADSHDVVAGDDLLSSEVGQREDVSSLDQDLARSMGNRQQAVNADVHRSQEAGTTDGVRWAFEVLDGSVSDRVQHKIDLAVEFFGFIEDPVEVGVDLDVAGSDQLGLQRFDQFSEAP